MSGKEKAKGSLALAAPRVITIPANVPEVDESSAWRPTPASL